MNETEWALLRATTATLIELLERDGSYKHAAKHLKQLTLQVEIDRTPTGMPPMPLSDARRNAMVLAMQAMIAEISEREYSAGWYSGIEFLVWRWLARTEGPRVRLGQHEADALRELSNMIEGWVDYEGYVPMAEWVKVVERKVAGGIDA